jgi:Zn-dependent protease
MLDERYSVPIAVIMPALLFSYNNIYSLPKYIGIFALIVLASVFAKKLAGYFVEVDVRTEVWDFRRYGLKESQKFKNPLPIGMILPIILLMFSYGTLKWPAITQTEFKAKITKQIKKRKPWSHVDVRELDIALICFAGIFSSIFIALVSFAFSKELALISLLYAFFNILPLGKLDGIKLFFSSKNIYFIAILALAGASVILSVLQV